MKIARLKNTEKTKSLVIVGFVALLGFSLHSCSERGVTIYDLEAQLYDANADLYTMCDSLSGTGALLASSDAEIICWQKFLIRP